MKRLISLIIVGLLLFSGCSEPTVDISQYDKIIDAESKTDLNGKYSADFRLNMVFGDEKATLLFAQGSYEADKTAHNTRVTAKMSQTVLGVASAVKVDYDGKTSKTDVDGKVSESAVTPDEFFSEMIYSGIIVPKKEHVKSIKIAKNDVGTIYTAEFDGIDETLFNFFGNDIYSMVFIKNPIHDKFACKNVSISYIITNDGIISDLTLDFIMSLYDTPPYNPGVSANNEDYMLDVFVNFTVKFKK